MSNEDPIPLSDIVAIDPHIPRSMKGMLAECRRQFLFYQDQHRAKRSPQADQKAAINALFASAIQRTLESDKTDELIEALFIALYAAEEWGDEHEKLLSQWRAARGEFAKDTWTWWVGDVDDVECACVASSREDAIARGRKMFSNEGRFKIVEMRMWADNVKEGDDITECADFRAMEVIRCILPPITPNGRAVDLGGRHG